MRSISAFSACALFLALAPAAQADCASPAEGMVVRTGADEGGLSSDADGLLVEIRPGATAEVPGDAVAVAARARMLNGGAIRGGDEGIVGSAGPAVENAGRIEAADEAIDADGQDGLAVVNTGSITAGAKAIRADDGAGASLDNAGAIEAGDDASVTNRAGGVIRGLEDAVQVGRGAFVANDGLVESTGPEGDGTILNAGTIRARGGAGVDSTARASTAAPWARRRWTTPARSRG